MLLLYIRKIQNVKRALENYKIAEIKKISIEEMDDKREAFKHHSFHSTQDTSLMNKRQICVSYGL